MAPPPRPGPPIEDLLRDLVPQVLGVLARRTGDFVGAEDAVQEAAIAAATRWPASGLPANPRGWLVQVASRRLTDAWRADGARRRREDRVAAMAVAASGTATGADDSLDLLFLCCHPLLTPGSAIPLTLRAVAGLTTAEIARAFFVPEATMAQRISRAKARIAEAEVPFASLDDAERVARLPSVLHVLYLLFNEGYSATAGDHLARPDLSGEAVRLARDVHRRLPDHPEVGGLLALMLLTEARRAARTDERGALVPLDEQDRSTWDRAMIDEGVAVLDAAFAQGRAGEYQLQAAVAALHDQAPSTDETDWPQILALYGILERMTGNPMVTLNRGIATAMVDGPEAGLAVIAPLDEPLRGDHHLDAVRGHLHELAGDDERAIACYRAAAARCTSRPERDHLTLRAARLHARGP